ncbi:unnamed protein product [Caenorhabditis nigoni]
MALILKMPELVLDKIIEFLDFKAVLTLRQVCQDFRNFIDDLKDSKLPDSKFSTIEMGKDDIKIRLTFQYPDYSQHQFVYSEIENSRSFNGKTTNMEDENIVDVAIRDLEHVLKFQKSTLKWTYFDIVDPNLHVKLSNMFRKLNRKIKTECLDIKSDSQSGFMSILPFADPETLKYIDLYPLDGDMEIETDDIVKTGQWKKVTEMNCDFHAVNLQVEDICHFSRFRVKSCTISAKDLVFLKKAITSSSKFEYSWLAVRNFDENEEVFNFWGPAFFNEFSSNWYFRIKDSDEKILRIKFCQDDSYFYCRIMEMRFVPNGAIVQDYNEN